MLDISELLLYPYFRVSKLTSSISYLYFAKTILKSHPRHNLGPHWIGKELEANYVRNFSEIYNSNYAKMHRGSPRLHRIMALEVPVNGFGIADLVTVSSDAALTIAILDNKIRELRSTVRAFEFKLSNWRRGLMQAYRYRYFADVSVLVIPPHKVPLKRNFLSTFRKLNVGLWFFDEEKKIISVAFTPRPKLPSVKKSREKTVLMILNSLNEPYSLPE